MSVWRGYPTEIRRGDQSTGFLRPVVPEMKVKVSKSCPTLCDSMDYTVHGILQARILEWIAVCFSRVSSWPRNQTGSPALQADSLPTELYIQPDSSTQDQQVKLGSLQTQLLPHCALIPPSWLLWPKYQTLPDQRDTDGDCC